MNERKREEGKRRRESRRCSGGAGGAESWETDCEGSREVLGEAATPAGGCSLPQVRLPHLLEDAAAGPGALLLRDREGEQPR